MKTEEFNKCREFLEKQIVENKENKDFLKAYEKLIELKSNYDKETDKALIEKEIREAELNTNYHATVHTNNTNHSMAVNENLSNIYQHQQTQYHNTINTAMQEGYISQQ